MPKKPVTKTDIRDLERLLKKALGALEALTQEQKKTSREVHQLKKRLDDTKLCKCCRAKKKKKKKKSKPEKPAKSVGRTNHLKLVADENFDATPTGLLNIVSAPVGGTADDLKWISGVGPKLEETLNELGIYHFEQIAKWDHSEIDWVDDYLQFSGRIERDNWIEQAKALAKGGWDEYVKVFGKEPR